MSVNITSVRGEHHRVFVTGGTGYMGRRLVASLVGCGHDVSVLCRPGSEEHVPKGVGIVPGDALHAASYRDTVAPCDTFVHLVGVTHPGPGKEDAFRTIDLASIQAAVDAAVSSGVQHFVYVSVAHPAPVMHAYIEARKKGEEMIRASGMNATILRPWYVLGPGHRWPSVLTPLYAAARLFPRLRDGARRLGLVTIRQMVASLVHAVDHPAEGVRVVEVPAIRVGRW